MSPQKYTHTQGAVDTCIILVENNLQTNGQDKVRPLQNKFICF